MTYRDTILPNARAAFKRRGMALPDMFVNFERYGNSALVTVFHDLDQAAKDALLSGNDYLGTSVYENGERFDCDLTDHGEVLKALDEREAEDSRRHEHGLVNWHYGRV